MDSNIYFETRNAEIKPQKVKSYVLFRNLNERVGDLDELVSAKSNNNEISVCFHGNSNSEVFTFDKIWNNTSEVELYDLVIKAAVQDVTMGFNRVLILCRLSSSATPFMEQESVNTLFNKILEDMFSNVKMDKTMDSTLHASFYEIHENKIFDFLGSSTECKHMKVFEISNQSCIEIKDLTEKPLIHESSISELISKGSVPCLNCSSGCRHAVLSATIAKKDINQDGFESLKTGNLFIVNIGECGSTLLDESNKLPTDDHIQTLNGKPEYREQSCTSNLGKILEPAFGKNAKTSIIISMASILSSPTKDLSTLQFLLKSQNILNYPQINQRLIIHNSLKEYSDEIEELHSDLSAIKAGTGVKVDSLMYRSLKSQYTIENEKSKLLKNQLQCLKDAINSKKQNLNSLHSTIRTIEYDFSEEERSSDNLKLELESMMEENKNLKKKVSDKADDILAIRNMKNSHEESMIELKSHLMKVNASYGESTISIHNLKEDLTVLSSEIGVEQETIKNCLTSLINNITKILSEFHSLQSDLFVKIKSLSEIDNSLKTWKHNTDSLISKFQSFMDEYAENFKVVDIEIRAKLPSILVSRVEVCDISRKNRTEKWDLLSYYFEKIKVFLDSSFNKLTKIQYELDTIQSSNEKRLTALSTGLSSSSEALKKLISEINISLKSPQKYFQEKEQLLHLTDIVSYHHNFKKNFDEHFENVTTSLQALKKMCFNHNEGAISKWNEIQKENSKMNQIHQSLSEHLSIIKKEMPKYTNTFNDLDVKVSDDPRISDKFEKIGNDANQLLHSHQEIKSVVECAFKINKTKTEKEVTEIEEYIHGQKMNVEKHYENCALKLQTTSKLFHDELKSVQAILSNNNTDLKTQIDTLMSLMSYLLGAFNDCVTVSSKILNKSEGSLKRFPEIKKDEYCYSSQDESMNPEWTECMLSTSTPKSKPCKPDLESEKHKLISRVKSFIEQKVLQETLDVDISKVQNESVKSLPNLTSQLKMDHFMPKSFSRKRSLKE